MSLYDLPKFERPKLKISYPKPWKSKIFWFIISSIFISSFFGFLAGIVSGSFFYLEVRDYLAELNVDFPEFQAVEKEYIPQTSQEEKIIRAVKKVSPSVVSIVITKDVPVFEQYFYNPFGESGDPFFSVPRYRQKGTEKQKAGGGTGFIVSKDGLILTNKHVTLLVLDEEADYTIFTNDGKSYPAKVLARDPFQDLAILKIDQEKIVNEEGELVVALFPIVELGDSDKLQIGQTVVAIGNALGEFRNTVSTGVVSGLSRQITASGGGLVETLEDVIQTDAAINKGNSGGPLLNLKGEVIGINTAMVEEAQNIGFAIPINKAKRAIEQVKTLGKITYAFLGVRYLIVNEAIQKENDLPVDYGAWIVKGAGGDSAVYPGSAAEEVGLEEGDILLEFGGERITSDNSLAKIIQKYSPGEKVVLKILRDGEEKIFVAVLKERSE